MWLNKDKLPPELQNLRSDEITERLHKAEDAAKKATELEAKVAEGDKTINELTKKVGQIDQLNSELAELRKKAESRQDPPPVVTAPAEMGLADWLVDPQKSFDASFDKKVGPLAQATLVSGVLAAKLSFVDMIQRLGGVEYRLWRKYEKEVSDLVEKLPPEQRIWPQSWVNQFTFVKGIHASEIAKDAQSGGDAFFAEGVTSTGGGIHQEDRPEKLTEMELHVAKMMKMTPEAYAASKKKLQSQGTGFWTK